MVVANSNVMFQLKAFDELSWKDMTLNQIYCVKMAKRRTRITRFRISVFNRSNMFWQRFGISRLFVTLVYCVFCRRPFVLTPLKKGSPYDAATLGFLLLAVRGAFLLEPKAAFTTGNFQLKEEARKWPVMCHIDKASGTIHVRIISR